MSVTINDWEDGSFEGRFDTVAEAEAYVLEEEMDVVINDYTSLRGQSYRFNAEINAKKKDLQEG